MIEDGVRRDNHNERPLVEGRAGGSRLVELEKWVERAEGRQHIRALRRVRREQQGRGHNAQHPCADVQ